MKEIKTGDAYYKGLGLKKVIGHVSDKIEKKYERARKKLSLKQQRAWSKRAFYSYWLTLKAPK